MSQRVGGEFILISAFVVFYLPLVWLGYQLKEDEHQLTVMWPAVGLLMAVLYLAPLKRWPVIIVLQLACEYLLAVLMREPSLPTDILIFMLANTCDSVVGALVARSHLWRINIVRVTLVLQFLLATAAGAAVSAVFGAAATILGYGAQDYWLQWQLWGAANWLGTLVVAPVVLFWALPSRQLFRSLQLANRWEVPVYASALAASTWLVFSASQGGADSLFRAPALPLALALVIAFRLPPRWACMLALGAVLLGAVLGASGHNPFPGSNGYTRTLVLQTYLMLLACLALIVAVLMAAMKIALGQVKASETRYRHFIEMSSEAVWRVELDPPMPVSLTLEQQCQWLRAHARVVESNDEFRRFAGSDDRTTAATESRWMRSIAWCRLFEDQLESAASHGYSLDGLRLSAGQREAPRSFIIAFNGVVSEEHLHRIWCVARDVTEILDLNTRLLRERERLKAYAHQVVTAEERARRATAVDLHDGIGQSLTGMAMSLEVARMQAPQIAPLLDDVRTNLRRVQERTRNMIADLSPPGLYELGLAPALQWLAVHFRSQESLRVQLDCVVREEAIGMDLRILIFKLVRELLRNVIKHAGVDIASVKVRGDNRQVSIEVADKGRGFEWQMDMFGPRPEGFGLWSISDRVSDVGGTFTVDAAPGRGARFTLDFPLSQ